MKMTARERFLLQRLRRDFEYFANYLGYSLAPFHREMVSLAVKHRFVAILAPRGHGKTELMSVLYPVWVALRESGREILVVSSTFNQSKKIIERIKEKIDNDPFLRKVLKPTTREEKWSAVEIHTRTRCKIIARPFQPSIRGLHVDLAICDDILQDTDYSVARSKELFNSVVMPTVQTKKGKLFVVGTPIADNDLFGDLMDPKKYPQFVTRRYMALMDGRPLWEERFTVQELENIRNNMSILAWQREYMCQPVPSGVLLFKEEDVHACVDRSLPFAPVPREDFVYYAGVDLAAGAEDYTVVAVLGVHVDRAEYFVPYYWRVKQRVSPSQLIEVLKELHSVFDFEKITIEVTGLGAGYYNEVVTDPVLAPVVEPFETKRRSKERILSKLEVVIRNHRIRFPDDEDLIKELTSIGVVEKGGKIRLEALRGHDDIVMALAIALDAATSIPRADLFVDFVSVV